MAVNVVAIFLVILDVSGDALVAEVAVAINEVMSIVEETVVGVTLLMGFARIAAVNLLTAAPLDPVVFV